MKRIKCVRIVMILLLVQGVLQAQERDELADLRHKAAKEKSMDAYNDVCRYLYEHETEPDLLLLYSDSIYRLAVRDKSANGFSHSYNWSSEAYFTKGDFTKGFALKQKALALAENAGKTDDIVMLCGDIGYYYNVSARYDSARHYLKKGIRLAEKNPDQAENHRVMLTNYASSFLFEGKNDSALVYTLQVKERSLADRDTTMLIENLNQLGTIYRRLKNLDECIASFEDALRLCEAQNNFRTAAYIYGNIATVYCDWKRPADAIPFSKKAIEYALKLGNKQLVGICYVNLGAIQCKMADTREEGIATLLKAIPILTEVNNGRRLCEAYYHMVNVYRQQGRKDMAMMYLEKLDKLAGKLKTDVELYRYYQAKASMMQANGQYAKAVDYYLRMVDLLQKGYKDPVDYQQYMCLSDCYQALHKDASAYDYLKKAYALRDSAFHTQYAERMSEYAVKYETKEKELEITRLRENELKTEKERLHRRILFGSLLALLLIALLVLLNARQRQKVRLAKLAQAAGEKERQFLALQKETESRLTRKYIDGLESERERIATELHDDVCNNLLAFEMNFRSTGQPAGKELGGQLEFLQDIRERLRNISHELMPPAFQYATIDEMLTDYVTHLTLPTQVRAEYHSTEGVDWNKIPREIGFEFYRIVQEAVNNAMKYAEASCIRVSLNLRDNCLSVLVEDDGKGFDPGRKTTGIGLHTIRQRANLIGGEVELHTAPGAGVRIKVAVNVSNYE